MHYKGINVWSLIVSASIYKTSWQPKLAQARKAFALISKRKLNGTLEFTPEVAKQKNIMALPKDVIILIFDHLREILKKEADWKDDPTCDYHFGPPMDLPNWKFKYLEEWAMLHGEVFETTFFGLHKRVFDSNATGCPCCFHLCYGIDHGFQLEWDPMRQRCRYGICDPREHWKEVKKYFQAEKFQQIKEDIDAFLKWHGLQLLDELFDADMHKPWYDPMGIQAEVGTTMYRKRGQTQEQALHMRFGRAARDFILEGINCDQKTDKPNGWDERWG